MKPTHSEAIDCAKPLLGVLVGFGFGLLAALYVHPDWKGTVEGFMFPRWLGLMFSLILWAVGTISRQRQLHCGGIKELTDTDRSRYGNIAIVVLFTFAFAILAYGTGQEIGFVLLSVMVILIILSEVGYGKPWAFAKVLIGREI